eukprot:m.183944 g.183944  ORF g.183944 m.183944 type:complete len:174 (+) comp15388_c14_seq1:175-696(+)
MTGKQPHPQPHHTLPAGEEHARTAHSVSPAGPLTSGDGLHRAQSLPDINQGDEPAPPSSTPPPLKAIVSGIRRLFGLASTAMVGPDGDEGEEDVDDHEACTYGYDEIPKRRPHAASPLPPPSTASPSVGPAAGAAATVAGVSEPVVGGSPLARRRAGAAEPTPPPPPAAAAAL